MTQKKNHYRQATPAQTAEPSVSDAKKLLADQLERERSECAEQINALLKKYKCDIKVKLDYTEDGRTFGLPIIVNVEA